MSQEQATERRKRQPACVFCRGRKTKCDGPERLSKICSTCSAHGVRCMYADTFKNPPTAYVRALEDRLNRMDVLLKRVYGGDYSPMLDSGSGSEDVTYITPKTSPNQDQFLPPSASNPILLTAHDELGAESSDDDVPADILEAASAHPTTTRFFGRSSTTGIIRQAVETKSTLMGRSLNHDPRQPEDWISSWESEGLWNRHTPRAYTFPAPDLLRTLINVYFVEINILWPLLHRPTFEEFIAEGLYFADDEFAGVVLLVCATASRFVDDPRVLSHGSQLLSAGWRYYTQVQLGETALLKPPSLFNLQMRCLAAVFLRGSSAPQSSCQVIGVGIRLAQDVGAHRRKVYGRGPSAIRELWKRAFWCLVFHDRFSSAIMGRACAIQDEDFDLELPTECDDEFWVPSGTGRAFEQPTHRPSYTSFFIWNLKLHNIVAFALRTIYSLKKSKVALGFVGMEWEQKTVAELDTALEQWLQSIPEHLRWDPERVDDIFFHQSAILRCAYYSTQMMIYQPFIMHPNKSPMRRPAMEICTIAARACSAVLAAHVQRCKKPLPLQLGPALTSAVVLLTRMWSAKLTGTGEVPAKDLGNVYICMLVLKQLESHWNIAGRLGDSLRELLNLDELLSPSEMQTSVPSRTGLGTPSTQYTRTNTAVTSGAHHEEPLDIQAADFTSFPALNFTNWPGSPPGLATMWPSEPVSWPSSFPPTDPNAVITPTGESVAWLDASSSWQANDWNAWMAGMSTA